MLERIGQLPSNLESPGILWSSLPFQRILSRELLSTGAGRRRSVFMCLSYLSSCCDKMLCPETCPYLSNAGEPQLTISHMPFWKFLYLSKPLLILSFPIFPSVPTCYPMLLHSAVRSTVHRKWLKQESAPLGWVWWC